MALMFALVASCLAPVGVGAFVADHAELQKQEALAWNRMEMEHQQAIWDSQVNTQEWASFVAHASHSNSRDKQREEDVEASVALDRDFDIPIHGDFFKQAASESGPTLRAMAAEELEAAELLPNGESSRLAPRRHVKAPVAASSKATPGLRGMSANEK
eukprot:TRINITY_DN45338_c0_g1_i1.p1 TRINITY_DN45338_c0_g1~~TRINITY_DN45338_c0_g1_i1.p1  ORF type:complete len:181 (-),score=34.44 TRINITY_DN45338_c0_g1_i1:82-555(-)